MVCYLECVSGSLEMVDADLDVNVSLTRTHTIVTSMHHGKGGMTKQRRGIKAMCRVPGSS